MPIAEIIAPNRAVALIGLVIYLIFMVWIGMAYTKRQKTSADYLLGGFGMGPNMIAISNLSLVVSAATFMGYGGMGFTMGVTGLWCVWPIWLGYWLWARYGAPRIRAKGKFTTLPEYLEAQYGGKTARKVCSVIVILRDAGWVATGMTGFGIMGDVLMGVDYWLSALIGLAVTVLYVWLGGYLAATITNFVQTILIFLGSIAVAAAAIAKCGGFGATLDLIASNHPTAWSALNVPLQQIFAWIIIYQFFSWCVQSVVIKQSLSATDARCAMLGSSQSHMIQAFWYAIPFLLGIIARAAFTDGIGVTAEDAYLNLVMWVGGPAVGSLLLIPFAAAVMSTADTALLSASSNIVNDWYVIAKPQSTEQQRISVARWSVVIIAILSYVIALLLPLVLELAMLGLKYCNLLFPAIVCSIFWKRAEGCKKSYFASILAGFIVLTGLLIWQAQGSAQIVGTAVVYSIDPILIALPVSAIVMVIGVFVEGKQKGAVCEQELFAAEAQADARQ